MEENAEKIEAIVAGFERLPDDALVPDRVPAAIFGCSRNTVWRRAKAGGIWPRPIKVSEQQTRFRVGDIRKALQALSAA